MGEDVESVMGGVRMGVNVDIKRTDGEYSRYSPISTPVGWDRKQRHCVVGFTFGLYFCKSGKKIERALKCSTYK